jgi:hypothetical protein
MAWGQNATVSLAYINSYVGTRIAQLRQALEDLNDFNTYYLTPIGGATGLEAAPISMAAGDATQLAACIGDIVSLYSVYFGNASIAANGTITLSPGTGHNFDLNTKLGAGIAIHG